MVRQRNGAYANRRHTYSILSIALRHPKLFNRLVKTVEERKKK